MGEEQLVTLIISTIFVAGGIYAYARQIWQLRGLAKSGQRVVARVTSKVDEEISEDGLTTYFVEYEFTDSRGAARSQNVDVERRRFYDSVQVGDQIDLYWNSAQPEISYPERFVRDNIKLYARIIAALGLFYVFVNITVALVQ